jgi:hypothetical protein
MQRTDPVIRQALESLAVDNKLDPVAVVEAARDETSPLHDCFTWDNSEAAHQFRLIEARKLIQVHVTILAGSTETVQAWVSLRDDRQAGGGYRPIGVVMSRKTMRESLLRDALADLETWRRKYATLKELAGIFAAHDRVKKKH